MSKDKRPKVMLFSSGLDSFLSDFFLGGEYKRVYFDLNSKYTDCELEHLEKFYGASDNFDVIDAIDVSDIEAEDAHVPNRNALMITYVASKYNPSEIYINGVKDDRVEDNCLNFYMSMTSLLANLGYENIRVRSPLFSKEKSEWVKKYADEVNSKIKLNLLNKTYSCFSKDYTTRVVPVFSAVGDGGDTKFQKGTVMEVSGCMECAACYRRFAALTAADLYVPFRNFPLAVSYLNNIDPEKHPQRYKTAGDYAFFLQAIKSKLENM